MLPTMRISQRYQVAIVIALAEILLLGLLWISHLSYARTHSDPTLAAQAAATGRLIAASAIEPLAAFDIERLQTLADALIDEYNLDHVSVTDANGSILAAAGRKTNPGLTVAGKHDIYAAKDLLGNVQLEISRADTLAAITPQTRWDVVFVIPAMVLLALMALTLWRLLTRDLRSLSKGAAAIAAGDYGAKLPESGGDEVAELARNVNAIASRLRHNLDELNRGNRRFRDMAENISDWLWEADLDGRYTYASQQVESLLGYSPDEVVGRKAFEFMGRDDSRRLRGVFEEVKKERKPFYGFEYRASRKGGNGVTFEVNGTPIIDHVGRLTGYHGVTRDITRRKEDESRLVYLAERDALTGLFDRQKFIKLLDNEIKLSSYSGTPATILFIDLDGFKLINDTHGHIAGDSLLRLVADMLFTQLNEGALLARLGGDEFGVILRGCGPDRGKLLAKRIINTIETTPLAIGEKAVRLFAGIGICSYPDGGLDNETLLAHAHSAMIHAKSLGHNRYHLYQASDTVLETMRQRVNWQTVIQDALEKGRLFLDFQVIAPLPENKETYYFEALLRLTDAEGNIHCASQFIDTAEHTGQVCEIDKWVLSNVLKTLAQPGNENCCISVNLSGRSLGIPDYCDYFQQQVVDSGVSPGRIVFEITETAAILEIAKAESFLSRMKKQGFKFSLDDFGAGYSSFSYLKHLPVDQIKVDGSFIHHLDKSREDQIFVRSMVQIAHELGLETVAEFVQSQQILDILIDIGVDYVQGNHIAKPGPGLNRVTVEPKKGKAYKHRD